MDAAALGDLVLMMREDEVDATAVDVEIRAEILLRHGGAFDVPAGATLLAPGARPARRLGVAGFPKHEVGRVLLVAGHIDPRAGDLFVAILVGEPAVVGPGRHVEQHVSVLQRVGMAARDQPRYGPPSPGSSQSRAAPRRGQAAQRDAVLAEPGDGGLRQLADLDAALLGPSVNLIVDIGDVPDVDDLGIQRPQQTDEDVEDDQGPRVADMDAIIDRRTADIDTHAALGNAGRSRPSPGGWYRGCAMS
jgi:hypothetical protein